MEGIETFIDEEWESLSRLFSSEEDSNNLFLHLNDSNIFPNNSSKNESLFIPSDSTNFYCISQESSNNNEIGSTALFPNQASGVNFHHDLTNNTTFESMDFYTFMDCENNNSTSINPVFTDDVMEEILQLKADQLCQEQLSNAEIHPCKEMQIKRKYEAPSHRPKRKPRVSIDIKNKKNVPSKKNKKVGHISSTNEEENINNGGGNVQSTCSEDDSVTSQKLNSKGKAKAIRGAATDPQSLYARRRRERINERLKILQNLVPNGTKVDISTMLEEAVHYVKFLQLQIKLLSSDDHWMYAPIAYNAMDIGFFQKIVPNMWIH